MAIRNSKLFWGIVLGIIISVIGFISSYYILHKTSETNFCLSCHTMQAPYEEYQSTIHFKNQKGIRAECSDCHIPKEPLDFLIAKLKASKDIYHQFISKKIDTPELYEEHRLAMAQNVWEQLKATDSATCRSCHTLDAMEFASQSPEAQKMHNLGIQENQTCIDCHKGIAHFPPEMKMDDKALDDVLREAKQTSADAKVVYPFTPIQMGELATVYPATALNVIKTDGEKREVELVGFQMKGAELVIYLAEGQRLILASLTEAGLSAVKVLGDYSTDDYDNQWRPVSLTSTIETPVLADRKALWNYAGNLDTVYCSGCHAKISSKHYTVNAWPAVAKGMGARTDITSQNLDILTRYLQYNAKDIK